MKKPKSNKLVAKSEKTAPSSSNTMERLHIVIDPRSQSIFMIREGEPPSLSVITKVDMDTAGVKFETAIDLTIGFAFAETTSDEASFRAEKAKNYYKLQSVIGPDFAPVSFVSEIPSAAYTDDDRRAKYYNAIKTDIFDLDNSGRATGDNSIKRHLRKDR